MSDTYTFNRELLLNFGFSVSFTETLVWGIETHRNDIELDYIKRSTNNKGTVIIAASIPKKYINRLIIREKPFRVTTPNMSIRQAGFKTVDEVYNAVHEANTFLELVYDCDFCK